MITKFVLLVVCINLLCWIQVDAHAWLCPANEEWGHGPNCDAKCGPQTLQACHPEGMGCKCSSGYSRNEHGQCVPDFLCSIGSYPQPIYPNPNPQPIYPNLYPQPYYPDHYPYYPGSYPYYPNQYPQPIYPIQYPQPIYPAEPYHQPMYPEPPVIQPR